MLVYRDGGRWTDTLYDQRNPYENGLLFLSACPLQVLESVAVAKSTDIINAYIPNLSGTLVCIVFKHLSSHHSMHTTLLILVHGWTLSTVPLLTAPAVVLRSSSTIWWLRSEAQPPTSSVVSSPMRIRHLVRRRVEPPFSQSSSTTTPHVTRWFGDSDCLSRDSFLVVFSVLPRCDYKPVTWLLGS